VSLVNVTALRVIAAVSARSSQGHRCPALAERTGNLARLEVKVGEPCFGGLLVPLPHVGCLLLHRLQRDLQLGRLLDLGVLLGLCSSQRPQATTYRDA